MYTIEIEGELHMSDQDRIVLTEPEFRIECKNGKSYIHGGCELDVEVSFDQNTNLPEESRNTGRIIISVKDMEAPGTTQYQETSALIKEKIRKFLMAVIETL